MYKTSDRAFVWSQFVSFKENSLNRERRSRHLQVFIFLDYLSFKSYHDWCWPYYLFVNSINISLVMDYPYKFIHGMVIPHLMYLTYAQMDVAFTEILCNYLSSCKGIRSRCTVRITERTLQRSHWFCTNKPITEWRKEGWVRMETGKVGVTIPGNSGWRFRIRQDRGPSHLRGVVDTRWRGRTCRFTSSTGMPRTPGWYWRSEPIPPTVPSVKHAGDMAVSEQAAPAHSAVQEGGGSEVTMFRSGGGKGGHI